MTEGSGEQEHGWIATMTGAVMIGFTLSGIALVIQWLYNHLMYHHHMF